MHKDMKWSETPNTGVWLSFYDNKVYMLRSFEAPVSVLRAKETQYRQIV